MSATNSFHIRPETPADYAAIGALHTHAFGNRAYEAVVVALLRQRRAFNPALALVAERDGRLVGHALFSPYPVQLLGQSVPAVILAPIAVAPDYQRQGIGGALIREGHAIATAGGCAFSLLLGHTDYYPRFGYQTHAFGQADISISLPSKTDEILETRPPTSEDTLHLHALWEHEEVNVDMAIDPGYDLLDWLSPHPLIDALVYLRAGEVVGYTRIHSNVVVDVRMFLAKDHTAALAMVATIVFNHRSVRTALRLPLHPQSASTGAFGAAKSAAWEAAMACPLAPSPLDDYLARVRKDEIPPGRVIWPVAFDLSE